MIIINFGAKVSRYTCDDGVKRVFIEGRSLNTPWGRVRSRTYIIGLSGKRGGGKPQLTVRGGDGIFRVYFLEYLPRWLQWMVS